MDVFIGLCLMAITILLVLILCGLGDIASKLDKLTKDKE